MNSRQKKANFHYSKKNYIPFTCVLRNLKYFILLDFAFVFFRVDGEALKGQKQFSNNNSRSCLNCCTGRQHYTIKMQQGKHANMLRILLNPPGFHQELKLQSDPDRVCRDRPYDVIIQSLRDF